MTSEKFEITFEQLARSSLLQHSQASWLGMARALGLGIYTFP